jgi:Cys-tRNA(Pro)/Cys-tRNA(Cys) deacylase
MTPAVEQAKRKGIFYRVHEYAHDPSIHSYGEEAAEKLGVEPARVFKTLVVELDGNRLAVGVAPVSGQLNLKRFARAAGGKKAAMAEPSKAERATGYVLGGISPLGQKKRLKTLVDRSAKQFETLFVSAGRRGLEIELKPNDLAELTQAEFHDIS